VRDFDAGELALREYMTGRVWLSNEGPRALFDRAVTWLRRNRVLLPGITTLARLVAEVRAGEQVLIYSVVDAEVTSELRRQQFIDSEAYRRMIGVQLNIGESRHALARRIFFGRHGELRHGYREGMEDQLGALGMALNAVVWWNTLYIDAAANRLQADGVAVSAEIRSRLSPLICDHINFHGRYPIVRSHHEAALRPLRDPTAENDQSWP
jgi:hypothetical protein